MGAVISRVGTPVKVNPPPNRTCNFHCIRLSPLLPQETYLSVIPPPLKKAFLSQRPKLSGGQ
jgi:hypothetical protein